MGRGIKALIFIILMIVSLKLHAQEIRVNNSFIILINDKLITTAAGVELILSDTTGKEEVIIGGYYPGVLYVNNVQTKNILYADSVRSLTLSFDYYTYRRENEAIHNYKIKISRHWFKESLIIVRIFDINKKRGTYKYTFDVPGHSFSKPSVSN